VSRNQDSGNVPSMAALVLIGRIARFSLTPEFWILTPEND
jgi:hypothetical protein